MAPFGFTFSDPAFLGSLVGSTPAPSYSWQTYQSFNFSEGTTEGAIFTPDGWPSGVTFSSDWSHYPITTVSGYVGSGVRFATQNEDGGASNSLYRVYQQWNHAAMVTGEITSKGRATYYIKIPTTGGPMYRGSDNEAKYTSMIWEMADEDGLQHLVFFEDQSTLGILIGHDSTLANWTTVAPTYTLELSPYIENGVWCKISIEWDLGATGYIRVTFEDSPTVRAEGDTTLNTASNYMRIYSVGGSVASDNDTTYFGALDEITVEKYAVTP